MALSLPIYVAIGALAVARPAPARQAAARRSDGPAGGAGRRARLLVRQLRRLPRPGIHLRPVRAADPVHLSALRGGVRRAVLRPADAAAARSPPSRVSYVGLALIFAEKVGKRGANAAIGAGLVLAAALAFAFYQLLAKPVIAVMGPRLFTCVAMSGAAVGAFVQFFVTHPPADLWSARASSRCRSFSPSARRCCRPSSSTRRCTASRPRPTPPSARVAGGDHPAGGR